MARRRSAEKRVVLPDAKFNDIEITKYINMVMIAGKKGTAETIVYGALDLMAARVKDRSPIELFHQLLDATRPQVEVRSRRVGGATYQVPVEVPVERSKALSRRWQIASARKRGEKTMMARLAGEWGDIMQNRGNSVKKREDVHKMAEANRAFAHYKW